MQQCLIYLQPAIPDYSVSVWVAKWPIRQTDGKFYSCQLQDSQSKRKLATSNVHIHTFSFSFLSLSTISIRNKWIDLEAVALSDITTCPLDSVKFQTSVPLYGTVFLHFNITQNASGKLSQITQ